MSNELKLDHTETLSGNPRLKKNNFDLLRLIFAAIVCFVHMHEVSGYSHLAWVHNVFSSEMAIRAFFIISGFLIFMSYENSTSLKSYVRKRILRIYPAYFTIVMLCAVGFVLISTKSIYDYFSIEWFKYLLANLTFMNFLHLTLPGVFDTNPMQAVNGALWTLKIEVMFYFAVPLFVYFFKRFSRFWVIFCIYFLSIGYSAVMAEMARRTGSAVYTEMARQLPGQLSYFMAGALLYYYLSLFERYIYYFLLVAAFIFIINFLITMPLLYPVALAIGIIFLALYFPVGNFGRYGDFSYGIYIIHFPVIQIFLHFQWFSKNAFNFMITVSIIVGILAILMWHLVEKRFLARSGHYVKAAGR